MAGARIVDFVSILLLVGSALAFFAGVGALAERNDLAALYWLVVGGLTLRAATEVLRPRAGSR
ncbi:MAG: hypothetical protein KF718_00140 [Polyangiaceae bacterium]|nr:hypothetical protein [Polyangiaceae bacterium]